MLNTVLLDLDGTLLPMAQEDFIEAYFQELAKKFVSIGLNAEKSTLAVWSGTKAMLKNDGTLSNSKRFWDEFASFYGGVADKLAYIEAETDHFYVNEFNLIKHVVSPTNLPLKLVSILKDKGYTVVLATNPLFPPQALESRLSWIGLTLEDFSLYTDYHNSRFCKPSPGYYQDIFAALKVQPEQCLMVGNTVVEDMSASQLGCCTFLITDYLENPEGADYSSYQQGTFSDFTSWAEQLPHIK